MLSVGIIGLPNVGKSTLFNALTAGNANVSNYPFTTIDSNVGMVAVPDQRLHRLKQILSPKECSPCFIQFIDIAGIVQGASQGEGLGNKFLDSIRKVDVIAEVVRCFQASDVAHVLPGVDPARDVEVIETELLLADWKILSDAIERRSRIWQTNPREHAQERERWIFYREQLEAGISLRSLGLDRDSIRILKGLGLLTGKPIFYVVNVSESEITDDDGKCLSELEESPIWQRAGFEPSILSISALFEWELLQLEAEERSAFMTEMSMTETGLEKLVSKAFRLLGLITFYTISNEKLQAWEIESGTVAPQAAGKIHSDMEQGFVRAQVVSIDSLRQHGSFGELSQLGLVRTEGKDYMIQDGDVVQFLFNN